MGGSATDMRLGGVTLGTNFPLYSRSVDYIRLDEQGSSVRKIKVTLAGFLEGANTEQVMILYQNLKTMVGVNDTTLTYTSGGTSIHASQACYIEAYSEPSDDYAKAAVGDYSISLYWFEDTGETVHVACTYGDYTFVKSPKWGRTISPNRQNYRAPIYGSTATIELEGQLYGNSNADLGAKIDALQEAFLSDGLLQYGWFAENVHIVNCDIQAVTIKNYATYKITVKYDIGAIVSLTQSIRIPRIHQNPVITEEPFCNRRIIELMNISSQTITYSISIEAADVPTARSLLITEANNLIIPGGLELPGGEEVWDYSNAKVDFSAIKFYQNAVIANLAGTGI